MICVKNCKLIAVSKGRSIEAMVRLFDAGIHDFGESYLQEALPKINNLADYPITWHYIGHLQSNKLKEVATYFSVIHSLDRFDHAEKLNRIAEQLGKTLQVFIQVNLDAEPQKGGVLLQELPLFITQLQALPHLEVLGLMMIPKPASIEETAKKFRQLKQVSVSLQGKIAAGLSMGMSADYEQAIIAGATHIRVGRALFDY
jgi:PLP dependent protein